MGGLVAVASRGDALQFASEDLRAERQVVLAAMSEPSGALRLEHVSADFRDDPAVVLMAVSRHGEDLQHASAPLKGNREVVLQAVARCGKALMYASAELQADEEVLRTVAEGIVPEDASASEQASCF